MSTDSIVRDLGVNSFSCNANNTDPETGLGLRRRNVYRRNSEVESQPSEQAIADMNRSTTQIRGGGKRLPERFNLSELTVGVLASIITTGVTFPLSSALTESFSQDMRLPSLDNILTREAFVGVLPQMSWAAIRWASLAILNQEAVRLVEHFAEGTELDDRVALKTGFTALLTALFLAITLEPLEQAANQRLAEGAGLLHTLSNMMRQGSARSLLCGVAASSLKQLPSASIRSISRRIGGGDKFKVKVFATQLSLTISPIKTYLNAVNALQMKADEAGEKLSAQWLDLILENPERVVGHILLAMMMIKFSSDLFYFTERTLEKALDVPKL